MALSLPDNTKLGNSESLITAANDATYQRTGAKRILIDISRSLLPEGMDLQQKRGFGMPFDSWLRGPLREVLNDTLSANSIRKRNFFDINEVRIIQNNFFSGKIDWTQPWLLMMTELWCREVLD